MEGDGWKIYGKYQGEVANVLQIPKNGLIDCVSCIDRRFVPKQMEQKVRRSNKYPGMKAGLTH